MKKIIFLSIIFFLLLGHPEAEENFQISSKEAVLYNLDTGEIIYEKNKDEKIPVASLTKLMTALVTVSEVDNLDSRVIIKKKILKALLKKI